MRRVTLSLLVLALLAGCASSEDRRTLESYYRPSPPATSSTVLPPGELTTFIAGVAASGTTQENTIQGKRVRGVYSGAYGGCHHVAVLDLDVEKKRQIRAENYKVCGTQISRVDDEVTPSYPDQADAMAALNNARRNALLYGYQTAWFQQYAINTRRLGVSSSQPCQPVETRITYQGKLVLQDVVQVCN